MIFHAFDVSADGNVEAKVKRYFSFLFLAKRKKVNLKL